MSLMYIVLAPLFGKVLFDRIRLINRSIRHKDADAIKVNLLFLGLILIVSVGLGFIIQH
jgi:hypothetical protein